MLLHKHRQKGSSQCIYEHSAVGESFQHAINDMKQNSDQICAKYQKLMEENSVSTFII
jgi:hypothetical protein